MKLNSLKSQNQKRMDQILFVCVENSCRSQIAEAIFNYLASKRNTPARASSAGTMPVTEIDSEAIKVLKEIDVNISNKKPKLITEEMIKQADRVITMGCLKKDVCPIIFFSKIEDWGIEDPKGKSIEKFREIRDIIKRKVEEFLSKYNYD
jgi:arsenate reductase